MSSTTLVNALKQSIGDGPAIELLAGGGPTPNVSNATGLLSPANGGTGTNASFETTGGSSITPLWIARVNRAGAIGGAFTINAPSASGASSGTPFDGQL